MRLHIKFNSEDCLAVVLRIYFECIVSLFMYMIVFNDYCKNSNSVTVLCCVIKQINKLHLCKPLIRAIDSLPIKDKFSISQLVTYRYFTFVFFSYNSVLMNANIFLLRLFS